MSTASCLSGSRRADRLDRIPFGIKLARISHLRGVARQSDLHKRLVAKAAERGDSAPSTATISRWFSNQAMPSMRECYDLAQILEVPMEYLADDRLTEAPIGLNEAEAELLWMIQSLGRDESLRRIAGEAAPAAAAPAHETPAPALPVRTALPAAVGSA